MTYLPPEPDRSRRWLNLSGAALLAVVAAIIVLCASALIAFCLLPTVAGMFTPDTPYPTPPYPRRSW